MGDLEAHDALQARIWNDERMSPEAREAALAMAWVLYRETGEGEPFNWKRLRELLGHTGPPYPRWRVDDLLASDAPRYNPGNWHHGPGPCEGPRLRPYKARRDAFEPRCLVSGHHPHLGDCRFTQVYGEPLPAPPRDDRVCGSRGTIHVTERDMVTGWETRHWFCSRHRERAAEVKAQIVARGEPPPPIPNSGGCLPRYFAADWAAVYTKACKEAMGAHWRRWEPYYGVDADDWPVPGKTLIPKRPRLSLVAG